MKFSFDPKLTGRSYHVVIEKGPTSYGAYVSNLAGCVAVGETEEQVKWLINEAIEFHLEISATQERLVEG